jgi:CRISPR/Cas system-associated exonuclease Cas4 (RecB family)
VPEGGDAAMTTTSELLLEWDRRKPRSQQKELGMSELGGCRRRAGYRLAGTEPSNPSGSVQAAMGSAIHQAIAEILEEIGTPGVSHEREVRFAGLIGHYDRLEGDVLVDVKTTSVRWLEHIKLHCPEIPHLWQVSLYAAALKLEGHEVNRVRIDYLARDSGEEFIWPNERGARFNPQHVRDALEWLQLVFDTELEMLPRDYDPDSSFCGHCPFFTICWQGHVQDRDRRTVLFAEDPDAGKWADELWDLRQQMKVLESREKTVKAALDAIRPDDGGRVKAGDRVLDFRRNARNPEAFSVYFVAGEAK